MSEETIHVVLASYDNDDLAKAALFDLRMDRKGKLIDFEDAALVTRDDEGKIHVKETADLGAGRGATFGGVVGFFLGTLAGPVGIILGSAAGAVIGGITAKVIDTGIPDERLKELGEAIQPGKSIIVVGVQERWLGDIELRLENDGAEVITEALKDDIVKQLGESKD
ncbi:MAG: DUF1269 domain-containing protein [Anaerolineales bacterium]|nr:DUF1269 domain-containing protein [Anaerolineales bacterium]MCK5314974.1 DUF1269 domain-containing protein [Anaerolineales bacterium]